VGGLLLIFNHTLPSPSSDDLYTYIYICINVSIFIFVHQYVYLYIHIHVYIHICRYISKYIHINIPLYVSPQGDLDRSIMHGRAPEPPPPEHPFRRNPQCQKRLQRAICIYIYIYIYIHKYISIYISIRTARGRNQIVLFSSLLEGLRPCAMVVQKKTNRELKKLKK
jgi:hypothetical protein